MMEVLPTLELPITRTLYFVLFWLTPVSLSPLSTLPTALERRLEILRISNSKKYFYISTWQTEAPKQPVSPSHPRIDP